MPEDHIEVCSPATGEPLGSVPIATRDDVAAAAAKARAAQIEWNQRSLADRCKVLTQVKNVIIDGADEICTLLSKEQG